MIARFSRVSALIVPRVRFGDDFIRDEVPAIGLSQALANGRAFVVRQHVDTGAPRLDFARMLRQFFLVFGGPSLDQLQSVF